MRCPKCHYLSFEPEPRCRNCGHSLELDAVEVVIRDEPPDTSSDLVLLPPQPADTNPPADSRAARSTGVTAGPFDTPRQAGTGEPVPPRRVSRPAPTPAARRRDPVTPAAPPPTTELPLFMKGLSETEAVERDVDVPLVKVPPAPRSPLAVRMKTGEPPARRPQTATPAAAEDTGFERDLLDALSRLDQLEERRGAARDQRSDSVLPGSAEDESIPPGTRVLSSIIDGALLGVTVAGVLWTTLRWCDLGILDVVILPPMPTIAFLLMIVVGYLLLFTAAGGQTIGKMIMGLRVVSDEDDASSPLTLGQAFFRACVAVPSMAVLGAGLIPGLVGNGRAVHDRLAHTRVVRA